jgi:hypothetical protein
MKIKDLRVFASPAFRPKPLTFAEHLPMPHSKLQSIAGTSQALSLITCESAQKYGIVILGIGLYSTGVVAFGGLFD